MALGGGGGTRMVRCMCGAPYRYGSLCEHPFYGMNKVKIWVEIMSVIPLHTVSMV